MKKVILTFITILIFIVVQNSLAQSYRADLRVASENLIGPPGHHEINVNMIVDLYEIVMLQLEMDETINYNCV